MAGELHDNAEARTFTPAGTESSRLVVSNGEMATFQGVQQSGGVSVADREQAMFANGFDFTQAGNIYGSRDTLAWDPKKAYGDVRQSGLGTDIVRVAMPPDIAHPFAGHEMSTITRIPEQAWSDAASMFPDLTRAGLGGDQVQKLSKAIVANELEHYDRFDQTDDATVRRTGSPFPVPWRHPEDATLGYAQISTDGVRKLSEEFPQLGDYLKKHGYPAGQEAKALTDPNMAPILIAGNLAHNAKMFEKHGIPVNDQTLGYGFNPDMFFEKADAKHEHPLNRDEAKDASKHGSPVEKALLPSPAVLAKSEHAQNVQRWLDWLKKTGSE